MMELLVGKICNESVRLHLLFHPSLVFFRMYVCYGYCYSRPAST